MDYNIEELLPIVSGLAQKYSLSRQSTSISYETAQSFMEAVIYCLDEYRNSETGTSVTTDISAREQYDIGYTLVVKKAEAVGKMFSVLSPYFDDYGVRCLRDTVQKGIPNFLKRYDARYCPHDTVITFDYPVRSDYDGKRGVDAVYAYLCAIKDEQEFLRKFDRGLIIDILQEYSARYGLDSRDLVENIREIVIRNF